MIYFYGMAISPWIRRHHKFLFYAAWLLINLVQAAATGLMDDEAYYWVYSRFPAWGYFDHPPMIALMIRAGYALFASEFGVRLLVVLAGTGTLAAIDSLLEKRDDRLFYAIALSMALLQLGGMIAVPDIPLLFFSSLYFLAYRNFLRAATVANSLLLGLVIALMLYSKYHGVLLVVFTLLSNLTLLRKANAWLAVAFSVLLFTPHLYWQYAHDFPSVRYHLFERNASSYRISFTTEYILGQVLLAGPLVGWLLLWAAFRKKPAHALERAYRWCFLGVYLLFLVSTLKGRAEANWTIPAWVPMIVLAHQYLVDHPRWGQWLYRLLIPSLLLIVSARVYMAMDIVPPAFLKKDEFHRNRAWAKAIHEKAAGRPVVFVNSYQRASQYWFYSGDTSFSLNNVNYRRNNYNFWPLEARLQGRSVLLCSPDDYRLFPDTIQNSRRQIGSTGISSYMSLSQLAIQGDAILRASADAGNRRVRTTVRVSMPVQLASSVQALGLDSAQLFLALAPEKKQSARLIPTGARLAQQRDSQLILDFVLPADLAPGQYRVRWGSAGPIPSWPSLNSSAVQLIVPE